MTLRDHDPIVIEEFNGLWDRGDADSVPQDHFSDCNNIQFIQSGFKTRDGLDTYRAVPNIVRIYNYVMQTGESLLILDGSGRIYHSINETTLYGPILTITGMTDFGFIPVAGRAYITPFFTETNALGVKSQRGMQNQFLYVYKGDGTNARKAAGPAPTNTSKKPFTAFNSQTDGVWTKGIHLLAVAYNGGILGTEVFPAVNAPGDKQITLVNIPIGPGGTTSRTIVATRAIDPKDYNPDQTTYTYYTAVTISDNTTTTKDLSIADAALTAVYAPGATAAPVTSALLAKNSATAGHNDFGFRLIGVVYETDTGYLTAPGPEFFASVTSVDINKSIDISNIPISPNSYVTKRHLVSTKTIPDYNGDQIGYQFFFIPEGTIENNTATTKNVSFFDSDLLEDASHLIDNFAEIPAGVNLTTYHGRLVLSASYTDISVTRLSAPGEPEAIDQVDGLIIVPLDGNPLTNAQEFRDILYLFKKTRTIGYVDNGDVPSSWGPVIIDQGIGAPVHGIGTVLDSGGVNIEYLLIADYSGMMLFNGAYTRPELSWKIKDLWTTIERNDFNLINVVNDSLSEIMYIVLPDGRILVGDYQNGINPKDIRWTPWSFDVQALTVTLVETNKLVIGA